MTVEDWLDGIVSSSDLDAAVASWVFRAGIAHKKLSPPDADAMRWLKDDIQITQQQLQNVLSKVADHSAADAAEVERCVARLLCDASWIGQLHAAPTPNSFETAKGQVEKIRMEPVRKGKDRTPPAIAFDQACRAEFAKRHADFKVHPSTTAGHAAKAINAVLKRRGFKKRSESAVYRKFKELTTLG